MFQYLSPHPVATSTAASAGGTLFKRRTGDVTEPSPAPEGLVGDPAAAEVSVQDLAPAAGSHAGESSPDEVPEATPAGAVVDPAGGGETSVVAPVMLGVLGLVGAAAAGGGHGHDAPPAPIYEVHPPVVETPVAPPPVAHPPAPASPPVDVAPVVDAPDTPPANAPADQTQPGIPAPDGPSSEPVQPDGHASDGHQAPAPAPPGVLQLTLLRDTGDRSDDNLTNDATVRVDGIAAGNGWSYSVDGGKTWNHGNDDGRIPALAFATEGEHQVQVVQIDPSGLQGAASQLDVVLDRSVGAPGIAVGHGSDQGALLIRGLEAGAHWLYSSDGGTSWTIGTGERLDLASLNDARSGDVLFRQIDAAGNESAPSGVPGVPTLTLRTDSGTGGDGWTNDATVLVDGLAPGVLWKYTIDGKTWAVGEDHQISAKVFGSDGDKTVTVAQLDADGAETGRQTLDFHLDTTAPHPSVMFGDGTVLTDGLVTRQSWANLVPSEGVVEAVLLRDGNWIGTVQFDASDAPFNNLLYRGGDGSYVVQLSESDRAGNVTAATYHFTLDTKAPLAPSVSLKNDTGISATDRRTADAALTIDNVESQASWKYSLDSGKTWNKGSGAELPGNVFAGDEGTHTVEVSQTDLAGNDSAVTVFTFTLDSSLAAVNPGAVI